MVTNSSMTTLSVFAHLSSIQGMGAPIEFEGGSYSFVASGSTESTNCVSN